jgi:hypothetical protein
LLVTVVAIASLCVATLSMVANGFGGRASLVQMSRAAQMAQQMQRMLAIRAARVSAALPATSRPALRALTPVEIARALKYVSEQMGEQVGGASLTDGQKDALTRLLSADNQRLIDPDTRLGWEAGGSRQFIRITITPDHTLTLMIRRNKPPPDSAMLRLEANGRVLLNSSRPWPGAATLPAPVTTLSAQERQMLHDQHTAGLVSAVVLGVNPALACLLLVAAVDLLRCNPRGVRLLWVYMSA